MLRNNQRLSQGLSGLCPKLSCLVRGPADCLGRHLRLEPYSGGGGGGDISGGGGRLGRHDSRGTGDLTTVFSLDLCQAVTFKGL